MFLHTKKNQPANLINRSICPNFPKYFINFKYSDVWTLLFNEPQLVFNSSNDTKWNKNNNQISQLFWIVRGVTATFTRDIRFLNCFWKIKVINIYISTYHKLITWTMVEITHMCIFNSCQKKNQFHMSPLSISFRLSIDRFSISTPHHFINKLTVFHFKRIIIIWT